jgi:uncharacterized protein with NRDE domain
MCTLSIISVPQANWPRGPIGLRVVANRDEERDRPAALAPRWRPLDQNQARGATRAIWPTDPLGGGTWIAAADSGLVLALLNLNLEPEPFLPPGLLSRGLVIPRLIASRGAAAAMAALNHFDLDRFAPFRLVAAEAPGEGHSPRILEARWDREELTLAPAAHAPACFVSSGLGDSRVQRRLAVFEELVVQAGLTPQAQDHFHLHVWPDHPELSVLMSRPEARTVSITTVEVSAQTRDGAFAIRMGYQPVLEGGRLGLHEAANARPVVILGRGG